jgi:hypothetical protein
MTISGAPWWDIGSAHYPARLQQTTRRHYGCAPVHPLTVSHSRFLAVFQPFLGNLANLARNG